MNFGNVIQIFALISVFCPFYAQANCKCEQLSKFENGRHVCYCRAGYNVDSINQRRCQDIDECTDSNQTICEQICNNTIGSYYCSCNDGYFLSSPDSNKCEDIDECSDSNQTICEQICNNTIGSYYCSCNDGYIISSTDRNKCEVDCCSRVVDALPDLFEAPDSYNDTKYYLSRSLSNADIQMSQAICEMIGGYLLEIDDEAEYLFVKNYIKRFSGFLMVYTGANDEVQNGVWVFRHSGKPVTFFAWTVNQPTNDATCMTILFRNNDWRMDDYPCNDNRDDTRFLCEVPDSPM